MSKIKGSSLRLPAKGDSFQCRSVHSGWQRLAKTKARGVTLIELVIVVAMVSILATLATVGYRRYILSAKTGEATQMIGSIKSAQEAFKSETFRYLDVSPALDTPYPQGDLAEVGTKKFSWEDGDPASSRKNLKTLGVSSTDPVYYGYASVAGSASQQLPDLPLDFAQPDWSDPGGPWYLVVAMADLDGDGTYGAYASSSFTAQIASLRQGE